MLLAAAWLLSTSAIAQSTERVSVNSAGVEGVSDSDHPAISADGRHVAFASWASNLVPNDTNGGWDCFVHDRQTGQTVRISVDSAGLQCNGESIDPVLSADGRFVAFVSDGANLVPGDTNDRHDVFVHDRHTGQTRRVSVSTSGAQGNADSEFPSISADGRFVVFESGATNLVSGDTNGYLDVFVHDRATLQTSRISVNSAGVQGNGRSNSRSISADGRFVAFASYAPNLVPGDANGHRDAFVHDRWLDQTFRVSVSSAGGESNDASWLPSISADGGCVTFLSSARNLVPGDRNAAKDVFVRDRSSAQFSLTMFGSCPGTVSLAVDHASAGGKVAIACGGAGTFIRSSPPCAGLVLGILPPALTAILRADASGRAVLHLSASGGLCGRSVQAVDLTTCATTRVVVL